MLHGTFRSTPILSWDLSRCFKNPLKLLPDHKRYADKGLNIQINLLQLQALQNASSRRLNFGSSIRTSVSGGKWVDPLPIAIATVTADVTLAQRSPPGESVTGLQASIDVSNDTRGVFTITRTFDGTSLGRVQRLRCRFVLPSTI